MASNKPALPLIVGAGPAGLSAALMLARANLPVRIIDQAPAPMRESRAVLITPRTLALLEKTGVSDRLVASGNKVSGARLFINGKERAHVSFDAIPHKHKFLLVVPQSTTERLMTEALAAKGVSVERRTRFMGAKVEQGSIAVRLANGDAQETSRASWLIGADGTQSAVRKAIGADFSSESHPFTWCLADLILNGEVPDDEAELHVFESGPIIARFPLGAGKHRVISNSPDVLDHLPEEWEAGECLWQSQFHASHRMTEKRALGRAVLIGDAAHTHSPVGGQGMNLGIEDAVNLADVIAATPKLDPVMITRQIEEEQRTRLRQWEQGRLARAQHALAFSDKLHTLAAEQSGLARRLLSFVDDSPLKTFALGLLTDCGAA